MAIVDSLLIAAPILQNYFVDKLSGEPLAFGKVYFYRNEDHSTFKAIYKQVDMGTQPPTYTYEPLENPIILGPSGTIVDENGDDIIPYYYPYLENDQTELDTYYVEVYDSNNVLQFTRSNFPLVNATAEEDTGAQERINLLPNGQFLAHNDLPNSGVVQNGSAQVSAISSTDASDTNNTSVIVAQGGAVGWYYIKNQGSASTDTITFEKVTSFQSGLDGDPNYVMVLDFGTPSSDSTKEIRIRFNNVNRFASGGTYTLALTAKADTANVNINVKTIKYFGSNGPTQIQSVVGTLEFVTDNYRIQPLSFSFGTNNQTVGSNGDDYVEIVLSPVVASNNAIGPLVIRLTDALLTPGNINISDYPQRPDHKVLDEAIAGSGTLPNPNGNDLYLPMILTRGGATYDHSVIGNIEQSVLSNSYIANQARLLCDGQHYLYNEYSEIGIPYSRLGSVLISDSPIANVPKFGTGANFATVYPNNGSTSILRLTVNSPGTPITDVTMSGTTNITPTNAVMYDVASSSASIGLTAYTTLANTVLAVSSTGVINATEVDSGLNPTINNYNTGILAQQKSSMTLTAVSVASLTAGIGVNGKYFNFTVNGVPYFMWFYVNGENVPAGTGTAIRINLNSSDTIQDVANVIREALNAFKVTTLSVTGIPDAGSYIAFKTNPAAVESYYLWYSTGATTDPAVPGATGIKVTLGGGETAATVATKTLQAINSHQYAVPDFRGMFLRGLDEAGTWDLDKAQRWSTVTALSGANLGTFEYAQFLSHNHSGSSVTLDPILGLEEHATPQTVYQQTGAVGQWKKSITPNANLTISTQGGTETRPVNAAVNFYIRY